MQKIERKLLHLAKNQWQKLLLYVSIKPTYKGPTHPIPWANILNVLALRDGGYIFQVPLQGLGAGHLQLKISKARRTVTLIFIPNPLGDSIRTQKYTNSAEKE